MCWWWGAIYRSISSGCVSHGAHCTSLPINCALTTSAREEGEGALPPPTMANRQYQWAVISLSCGVIAVTASPAASLPPAIGRLLSTAFSSLISPSLALALVLRVVVERTVLCKRSGQSSVLAAAAFLCDLSYDPLFSQWITFTCVMFSSVSCTSHLSLPHLFYPLLTCSRRLVEPLFSSAESFSIALAAAVAILAIHQQAHMITSS